MSDSSPTSSERAAHRMLGAPWLAPSLLVLLTLAAFAPGLDGDFVNDDRRFISMNTEIRDLGNVLRFFTEPETMTARTAVEGWNDIYRPLRTLAFAVDWALFGENARGYRIVNLLWHLAAVLLAWRLTRRWLGDPWLAALATSVFALHPAQAQTVCWISSRGDLMAGVFVLAAAGLLLREDAGPRRTSAAAVLYALALLSKESAVALVGLVVAHDLLLAESPRLRWRTLAVLAGVTALFLLVRFQLATGQEPFSARSLAAAGSGSLIVLGMALFPVGYVAHTGDLLTLEVLGVPAGWVLLAGFAALVGYLLARGRRSPRLAFAVLWFAVCLAPVSGLVPLKSLAESRFLHLPLLGLGMMVALVAPVLRGRRVVAAAMVPLMLGLLTARESRIWRSDRELWGASVRREEALLGRAGSRSLMNEGLAWLDAGMPRRAIPRLRRALAAHPTPLNEVDLALALVEIGEMEEAVDRARHVVRSVDNQAEPLSRAGVVLIRAGRSGEAVTPLERAAALAPWSPGVRRHLALALLRSGRPREARVQAEEAVRLEPRHSQAWILLGRAQHNLGAREEAERAYRRSVELDPGSFRAHLYLGRLRLAHGRDHEAVVDLRRALELSPGNAAIQAELLAASVGTGSVPAHEAVRRLGGLLNELRRRNDLRSCVAVLGRPSIRALRHPQLDAWRVEALLDLGADAAARAEVERLLPGRPDDPGLNAGLGRLELRAGRPAAAIPPLERAVRAGPMGDPCRLSLAEAYRAVGREQDAVRTAREALALPDVPEEVRTKLRRFLSDE
jgi:Flp pilus assembly protein TadD